MENFRKYNPKPKVWDYGSIVSSVLEAEDDNPDVWPGDYYKGEFGLYVYRPTGSGDAGDAWQRIS